MNAVDRVSFYLFLDPFGLPDQPTVILMIPMLFFDIFDFEQPSKRCKRVSFTGRKCNGRLRI